MICFNFVLKSFFFQFCHANPYYWEKMVKHFLLKKGWLATTFYQTSNEISYKPVFKIGVAGHTNLVSKSPLLVENNNELIHFFWYYKAHFVVCLAFCIKQAVKFHLYIPLENQIMKTYFHVVLISRYWHMVDSSFDIFFRMIISSPPKDLNLISNWKFSDVNFQLLVLVMPFFSR